MKGKALNEIEKAKQNQDFQNIPASSESKLPSDIRPEDIKEHSEKSEDSIENEGKASEQQEGGSPA